MKASMLTETTCVAITLAVWAVTVADTVVAKQCDALPARMLDHPRL
jgi:hypothetical protein